MKRHPARFLIALLVVGFTLWLLLRRPGQLFSTTADPPGILREVRLLKELVTVRYSIQKVTGLRENTSLLSSESILLIVQAKVLGGVDLSELRESDIQKAGGNRVTIRLPQPKILHVYFDEKNTQVWDRTKTWWTPWVPYDKDLEKKARLTALDSVQKEAIDMGILRDSEINAETLIRGLLQQFGFSTVQFRRETT